MEAAPVSAVKDTAAIALERLSMVYGEGSERVRALDRISLEIGHNEFFTLLGPSGCGKTTLLRLIAGFEQPTEGSIRLYGQPLEGLPPYRRPVNTVFQSYALFPHLSVAQNIAFGLEMLGKPRAEIAQVVREMLGLVKLVGYENRRPAQLSGGQQQRVALARALANRPKVLLLDESLSALDLKLRKEMQLELKRLHAETGITFVFVTHDQEEALTMSDRIAVMQEGRIAQVGTPTEIYDAPNSRYVADFIGETNFLKARARGGVLLLPDGSSLPTPVHTPDGEVTLAIRPERARLSADGSGISARVKDVVYKGTDTIYLLELPGQEPFQVRSQNRLGALQLVRPGDPVGLELPPEAVRVLKE
ncbi:ABC transporter ATP-binding protein [Meiothermus granaticius]|nr:ABC transporter ATP-binding protein [Meiothermus granaticius]GEM86417.1 polyamine-transporting ATPase [Meiothermus granaticius NBRC 107808]